MFALFFFTKRWTTFVDRVPIGKTVKAKCLILPSIFYKNPKQEFEAFTPV